MVGAASRRGGCKEQLYSVARGNVGLSFAPSAFKYAPKKKGRSAYRLIINYRSIELLHHRLPLALRPRGNQVAH